MTAPKWIVVSDFDGTLTEKDVGNELCNEFLGERWHRLHQDLRSKKLNLKDYQQQVWTNFPLGEQAMRSEARKYSKLRPGVKEFLGACASAQIKVFIASCGIRTYIESVLDHQLGPELRATIFEIRCNEAVFDAQKLVTLQPPESKHSEYPLDKGAYAQELAHRHTPRPKVFGLGNGTSDRSFVGFTDLLAATEGLASHLEASGQDFVPFEDFIDLMSKAQIREILKS
jgi:2-hydroxy-3-keto-5-methylthiopentenyl-1-phosphate phosphatase